MTTAKQPITFLHAENTEWNNRMDFYRAETQVLSRRLMDAIGIFDSKEQKALLEQFQNRLIIQKEQIDEISHDIRDHENFIVENISNNPVASDHRMLNDHPKLRERVLTFEKLYNELRKDFYLFIAKELK